MRGRPAVPADDMSRPADRDTALIHAASIQFSWYAHCTSETGAASLAEQSAKTQTGPFNSWLPEFRADARGGRRAREQTRGRRAMDRRVSSRPRAVHDPASTKRQPPAFLDRDEIALLTGFQRKARQIEQLRRMGVAFFINGGGRPVVTRAAIEGRAEVVSPRTWSPSVIDTQGRA